MTFAYSRIVKRPIKSACLHSLITGLALIFGSSLFSSYTQAETSYEASSVRAAVIFGVLRFTRWTDNVSEERAIRLCTYGSSPSGATISNLSDMPKFGQLTIELRLDISESELDACDAVIVGDKALRLDPLPPSLLVICDSCEPAKQSAFAIQLVQVDNRIRFEINLDQLQQQQLELSASLIELASKCSSSNPNIRGCDD